LIPGENGYDLFPDDILKIAIILQIYHFPDFGIEQDVEFDIVRSVGSHGCESWRPIS